MSQPTPPASPSLSPIAPVPTPGQTPRIDSRQLLQGSATLEIDHAGQRYQLRITRENKLILTK